ncbi:M81 family metallopeptidase [Phenylobacterium sp. LH3H17]|uniref:M81 family metallopeptidase n=1 Tax=Phenylobacterium sp. LH3H17 TaxID=2903901 RepID=UPI0020CA16EE|nr:M81 family metallopeptidase [Phenylobacterium sp. LH3H17]UTP38297.1 M81 family metallopeptidase [Phenylobacterium sp. LH3H17]
MRIFIGSLAVETISFSNFPVSLQCFQQEVLEYEDGTLRNPSNQLRAPREWRRLAEAEGHELIEGLQAIAQPGGYTVRSAYEGLRDWLLEQVKAAGPLDVILLLMHGAMAAEGYDDCEGDTLEKLRALVGPDVKIGVELDLHAHLTPRMVDNATAIITFKEYPHIDHAPRAVELYNLCLRAARGEVSPVSEVHETRMISLWRTPQQPTRGFVDRISALEGVDGVLSVSFVHGNPWLDVPDCGARILVVTDGDRAQARDLAAVLGAEIWELRNQARDSYVEIEEALELAAASPVRPVVFADVADNAGGGAPSDSTFLLKPLLAQTAASAVFGCVWDPIAVQICFDAGLGARLPLRIGGKCGATSGDAVDVQATVRGLIRDHDQAGQGRSPVGHSAWISVGNIDIVLISKRVQTLTTRVYDEFGIDLKSKDIVVAKSTQHFFASFSQLSERIIYVTSDGTLRPDFENIKYKKNISPYWPKFEDPRS